LRSESEAGRRLEDLFADGPPEDDDAVARATRLIVEAGGVDWVAGEADARVARARRRLDRLMLADRDAATDLATVADYIVNRGRLINASRT
jgi:geranylgeranyl pyrophosphate synthase